MGEEERAAAYRLQMQRREAAAAARWKALAGSAEAYQNLWDKLEPLTYDPGWDPVPTVIDEERVANG